MRLQTVLKRNTFEHWRDGKPSGFQNIWDWKLFETCSRMLCKWFVSWKMWAGYQLSDRDPTSVTDTAPKVHKYVICMLTQRCTMCTAHICLCILYVDTNNHAYMPGNMIIGGTFKCLICKQNRFYSKSTHTHTCTVVHTYICIFVADQSCLYDMIQADVIANETLNL